MYHDHVYPYEINTPTVYVEDMQREYEEKIDNLEEDINNLNVDLLWYKALCQDVIDHLLSGPIDESTARLISKLKIGAV